MYFEVFLKILVAFFALFGFFSLVKLIWCVWFGYDNVRVTVEIDSRDTVENIDEYLSEARTLCRIRGGSDLAVMIRKEFYDEKLVKKLEKRKLRYYVI